VSVRDTISSSMIFISLRFHGAIISIKD